MKVRNEPEGSRDMSLCVLFVYVIDCTQRLRSALLSGAKLKETPLGAKREVSYPPSVKLAGACFNLYCAPAVYPQVKLGIRFWSLRVCRYVGLESSGL